MKNVIIVFGIFIFIGCDEAEATNNSQNIVNKVVKPAEKAKVDEWANSGKWITIKKPVEINLDDMTFTDAFSIEHRAKGAGHTFWWRGDEYTTNLAALDEFVLDHASLNTKHLSWVLNSDDPDDNCKSNELDDCGVCDGPGKIMWFRDKDGDGLGAFTEWITSCAYPKVTEIEKFHEESLQEGGGDQGVMGD
tara:strand:+ start:155 stop:730 length:576 start_codon:yes stop_codon:yes gene_type:complete